MEIIKNFHDGLGMTYSLPESKMKRSKDLYSFLFGEAIESIVSTVRQLIHKTDRPHKIAADVQIEFEKYDVIGDTVRTLQPWFTGNMSDNLFNINDVESYVSDAMNLVLDRVESFNENGSGWVFVRVCQLFLTVVATKSLSGGARPRTPLSSALPKLPERVRRKKGVIDSVCYPYTGENKCFLNAVIHGIIRMKWLRSLTDAGKRKRQFRLPMYSAMKWTALETELLDTRNLSFPTRLEQIHCFEQRNNLAVNVFGLTGKNDQMCVYHYTKDMNKILPTERCIDLLLYRKHYYLVTSLNRLIASPTYLQSRHVCRACLATFTTKLALKRHHELCISEGQKYNVPKTPEQSRFKFNNFKALTKNDHVVYYDIECILEKLPNDTQRHIPCAVGAIRLCSNETYNSELFINVGPDCLDVFVDWLADQENIIKILDTRVNVPIQMTTADELHHRDALSCEYCGGVFDDWVYTKNRDHDHFTGKYRFALCNSCNLISAKRSQKLYCLAHNACRYDHNLIVHSLARKMKNIRVIPKNRQQNLAIYCGNIVFLDSVRFLPESLSGLIKVKSTDGKMKGIDFPRLYAYYGSDRSVYDMLKMNKGVFPYDYLCCWSILKENHLPSKEDFYDSLNESAISEDQYQYARRVWHKTKCRSMEDYLKVYLTCDVLFLADVFEGYRDMFYTFFTLDVLHFLSTPHAAFNAMMKHTGVVLELPRSLEMVNFIKKGIRGGLSQISCRYAKANQPEMGIDYDANKTRVEIPYLDICNLYGFSMSQSLPVDGFRWLAEEKIDEITPNNLPSDDGEHGWILEVDLDYCEDLHELHSDLPLAPEHMSVPPAMWSRHAHKLFAAQQREPPNAKKETVKLLTHLGPRKNYVVHHVALAFYLRQGMKLEKIHRVLTFKQSPFMRTYIDFCTSQRQVATSDFMSFFWKSNINSIYGKLLQDESKKSNFKLVTDKQKFINETSKPNFKSLTIYTESLAGIEMKRPVIMLNKPYAVGMTVLELSKKHLYSFHYLYVKKMYGSAAKLLFTDTDSLVYSITGIERPFALDMYENRQYFDMSNYPIDSQYYSAENHRRRGTMKNEKPIPNFIVEYVGLRAKVYCLKTCDGHTENKAKGIKKSVLAKQIQFHQYIDALTNTEPDLEAEERLQIRKICAENYQISTKTGTRRTLCGFDTKRYILENGIDTYAYFHKNIEKIDVTKHISC